MTIPLKEFMAKSLTDPEVKREFDALEQEFAISSELIRARARAGLSQTELAERMGTSQSAIARIESGRTLPSAKTLIRFAEATGSKIKLQLLAA
jgi:ribosome-binding protein aMBF1 (putative translation factor)